MNLRVYRKFVLLTVITACTASSFSEDLDAALEAQKKKAQRRVYSESALLHEQNLVVPREASAEEKAIDRELQAMEARQKTEPSSLMQQPSRPAVTVRPAENPNWLTAAILDNEASVQTNITDDTWLARELDRQKEKKAMEAVGRENELVEKLLREKTQQQSGSPELDRLKQYQLTPPKLFGSQDKDSDTPSYMTPRSSTPDPLATIRLTPKKETPSTPPLFSPEAARRSPAPEKNPLRPAGSPSLSPVPGALSRKPSSGSVFSPDWNEPEPAVPTPLEIIRKSSPINRQDPFADDHMPKIKTSIWE